MQKLQKCRLMLFAVIMASFLVLVLVLFYLIRDSNLYPIVVKLLWKYYSPMFVPIIGFYFLNLRYLAGKFFFKEIYIIAIIIVPILALMPLLLCVMSTSYQQFFKTLEAIQDYSNFFAIPVIVYFFRKSA